jgi:hypothetical protein
MQEIFEVLEALPRNVKMDGALLRSLADLIGNPLLNARVTRANHEMGATTVLLALAFFIYRRKIILAP